MPQNLDSKYSLEIYDLATNSLIADFQGKAKSRSIKMIRNGTYEAQWTLDLDALEKLGRDTMVNPRSIIGLGQNYVVIKRLGVPVFGGLITRDNGSVGSIDRSLVINCVGWLDLFASRYTGSAQNYAATDAGAIAWALINTSQTGSNQSFGVTSGTITTSVNRDRTYERKNIKDAIIELSQVLNGFDFEFTWDRRFNVWYPMGRTITEFNLEYPKNIKSFSVSRDTKDLVNRAIVRGQGFGGVQGVQTRDDATSQTAFKVREKLVDYSDVSETATLNDHGDAILAAQKDVIKILSVKVDGNLQPIGSFAIGDRVPVLINGLQFYADINANYRIDEITIRIDDLDSEEIELKLTP